eukprot:6376391-Prymnesium_polylepis.1
MESSFKLVGSVEDFGHARQQSLSLSFDESLGTTGSTVTAITGSSVNVVITTPMDSEQAYDAAAARVSTAFGSLAAIRNALGVEALDLPRVAVKITYGDDDSAVIIGGAVGGAAGIVLLMAATMLFVMRQRRRSAKVRYGVEERSSTTGAGSDKE